MRRGVKARFTIPRRRAWSGGSVATIDGVVSIDIANETGSVLTNGTGLTSLSLTSLDLTGVLAAFGATITINLPGSRTVEKKFSVSVADMADNVGLGDDVAKLLDAFNTPTFESVQGFLERLEVIGVLGEAIGAISMIPPLTN